MRLFITALLLVCLVIAAPAAKAQSNLIDLELVIAVDVSGSVDDDEAALQPLQLMTMRPHFNRKDT